MTFKTLAEKEEALASSKSRLNDLKRQVASAESTIADIESAEVKPAFREGDVITVSSMPHFVRLVVRRNGALVAVDSVGMPQGNSELLNDGMTYTLVGNVFERNSPGLAAFYGGVKE